MTFKRRSWINSLKLNSLIHSNCAVRYLVHWEPFLFIRFKIKIGTIVKRKKLLQKKYLQLFCLCMHICAFTIRHPRILLTILSQKTEIGGEFNNSLTLFLKFIRSLVCLYSKIPSCVCLIRLKGLLPCLLFSPCDSCCQREKTPHQGHILGKGNLKVFKWNGCFDYFVLFLLPPTHPTAPLEISVPA